MIQALTTSLPGYSFQDQTWQRLIGSAILALLLIVVMTSPSIHSCPV